MRMSKIILVVSAMSIFSCSLNAQYLKEQKLKQNISSSKDTSQKLSEKSPVLAGALSLVVPGFGLGQLYNGETGKFLTHTIISTACISTYLLTAGFGFFRIDAGGGHHDAPVLSGILLFTAALVYAGNYIVSVFDAVDSAIRINEKVRLQKKHTDIINNLRFGFTINKNKQLNLKFELDL